MNIDGPERLNVERYLLRAPSARIISPVLHKCFTVYNFNSNWTSCVNIAHFLLKDVSISFCSFLCHCSLLLNPSLQIDSTKTKPLVSSQLVSKHGYILMTKALQTKVCYGLTSLRTSSFLLKLHCKKKTKTRGIP